MTVMAGGPYGTPGSIGLIIKEVSQHLGLSSGHELKPIYTRVAMKESCIPIPTPGHLQRMEELKGVLKNGIWNGKLEIIGAGVRGVSVGDCVESGKRAGKEWVV